MRSGGVDAHDNSRVSISGGLIDSLRAGFTSGEHTSIITIAGSFDDYDYGEIPDASGTLIGVLANGDPINAPFEIHGDASIILVPEPCAWIILATAAVAFLGFARRTTRRRRSAR